MLRCAEAGAVGAVNLPGEKGLEQLLAHFANGNFGNRKGPPGCDGRRQDGGFQLGEPAVDAVDVQGEAAGRMASRRCTDHMHRVLTAC